MLFVALVGIVAYLLAMAPDTCRARARVRVSRPRAAFLATCFVVLYVGANVAVAHGMFFDDHFFEDKVFHFKRWGW